MGDGGDMTALQRLLDGLASAPACLVTVESIQGSAPREPGAWMAVFGAAQGPVIGTIGGGHLEWQSIADAREWLAAAPAGGAPDTRLVRHALGPSLGQCCGGVVQVRLERITAAQAPALRERLAPRLTPVALFGGGHVGHALARVLAPLPFALHWIDSRDGIFPFQAAPGTVCEHSEPVQGAVPTLAAGSLVLVMSFSHAEDLDVVAACLQRRRARGDLPFIGMIGSRTKWATFRRRLAERGFTEAELAGVTCPIGVPGIAGKAPEVIAVAVAAQLLQQVAGSAAGG